MREIALSSLDLQFIKRTSSYSYTNDPISKEEVATLFEAARWAPSSYNEQPWVFVYASKSEDRTKFLEVLVEANQKWAKDAPLLIVLFAKKKFDRNGKENNHAEFDCGAAWMSLALQAEKLGYSAHAMAGFDSQKAYEVCKIDPETAKALCVIAVGKRAGEDKLSDRKPQDEFVFESQFQALTKSD